MVFGKNTCLADKGEQHESKLTHLRKSQCKEDILVTGGFEYFANEQDYQCFNGNHGKGKCDYGSGLAGDQAEIYGCTYGHEEESEQEPLEGVEIAFQLMLEFAVGKNDAGEEGTQRRAQADQVHQVGDSHHDEQGRCGEQFAEPGAGYQPEQRYDGVSADNDHGSYCPQHRSRLKPAGKTFQRSFRHRRSGSRIKNQQGDEREHRDYRKVLEKKYGKGVPSGSCVAKAFLFKGLHHDGR